jgi:hypothetical protein
MKTAKKAGCLVLILLGAMVTFPGTLRAQNETALDSISSRDRLRPASPGTVKIEGYLGKRIDQCIKNRIMVQDVGRLLSLFKTKERDPGGYQGEFIGKWLAGAALGSAGAGAGSLGAGSAAGGSAGGAGSAAGAPSAGGGS